MTETGEESRIRKILLIEDDRDYRNLLKTYLTKYLQDVEIVEYDPVSKGAPTENFDWSPYDILILDYYLCIYGHTGLDLLQKHRKKPGFPATLMITGAGDEEVAVRALNIGVYEYLRKEKVTRESLIESVKNAFNKHRGDQQKFREHEKVSNTFDKTLFYRELEQPSGTIERALIVIDVDDMDNLTSEYGFIVHDNLLRHFARTSFDVFKHIYDELYITRLTDSSVAVLVKAPHKVEKLENELQDLKDHFQKNGYIFGGKPVSCTVSIGALFIEQVDVPTDHLVKAANRACDMARRVSGNSSQVITLKEFQEQEHRQEQEKKRQAEEKHRSEERQKLDEERQILAEEKRKFEEEEQKRLKEQQLREEEEKRRDEAERKQLEEERLSLAEEKRKFREEEQKRLKEQQLREEEEKRRDEAERKQLEEERLRLAEEKRKFEEEEQKRLEEQQQREEEERQKEEEERQKLEAERKQLEEERLRLAEEKRKFEEEEQKRLDELHQREKEEKQKEEEEQHKLQEERKRLEAEKQRLAEEKHKLEEEEQKRKEELRHREEEEKRKEEARHKLEKERKDLEAKRLKLEEEKKRRKAAAEKERLRIAEAERKRKEEEERLRQLELQRKRQEEEARRKAEAEHKKREEEKRLLAEKKEKLRLAEEERRRKEERLRKLEEQNRQAEERRRREKEAKHKAEEQKRLEEEKKRKAENDEKLRLIKEKQQRLEQQKGKDSAAQDESPSDDEILSFPLDVSIPAEAGLSIDKMSGRISEKPVENKEKTKPRNEKEETREEEKPATASDNDVVVNEAELNEQARTLKKAFKENRGIQTFQPVVAMFTPETETTNALFKVSFQIIDNAGNITTAEEIKKWNTVFSLQQYIDHWLLRETVGRIANNADLQSGKIFIITISEAWLKDIALFNWLKKLLTGLEDLKPGKRIALEIPASMLTEHRKRALPLINALKKTYGFRMALGDIKSIEELSKLSDVLEFRLFFINYKLTEELAANVEESQKLIESLKSKGARLVVDGIEDSTMLTTAISHGADYVMGSFVGGAETYITASGNVESFDII